MGGLVCGCYLAKAGMKVLIAEQHAKPGGYCTSFRRRGFLFDAAAHSIGGYKRGHIGNVLKDLHIMDKIKFLKVDPSDVIISRDYRVSFWEDGNKTIRELQQVFPEEKKSIGDFFSFLSGPDPKIFSLMRKWTFENLLDRYFTNIKLKGLLSFPLFGNGGLPPTRMAAFVGVKIYQEFLLDGGYYPEGGMQVLSDTLAERFVEMGGELRLSCPVKKVTLKNNAVIGIILNDGQFLASRCVISNCDARQTFFSLLGKRVLEPAFIAQIESMVPSLSGFILYLGLEGHPKHLPEPGVNLWYLFNYDLQAAYVAAVKGDFRHVGGYVLHVSPDKKTVFVFINAPYKTGHYWRFNKTKLLDFFIRRIEAETIPDLSKHILVKDAATPLTLKRYTSNYKGATFGWASTPQQLAIPDLRKPSFLQGLYLTGHWTTHGLGIPGVVYLGYDTARMILKKRKSD